MKNYIKVICLGLLMALCASVITGCNTIEGIGEDIEAGGSAIKDAADDD